MPRSVYQLAQINIAHMVAPLDTPVMADFMAGLAPINALAEASPGFVWRFQTPAGDATAERPYDDDRIIVNFSVWESVEALRDFVYRGDHVVYMRRRREWFELMKEAFQTLWWVPAGHEPTVAEAVERLEHLRRHGPSAYAFTFRDLYPPPDASAGVALDPVEDACPAT